MCQYIDKIIALEKLLTGDQETESRGSLQTLIDFDKLIKHLASNNLPDYDTFRNVLNTELDKHRNEPDFDKFDWQKSK